MELLLCDKMGKKNNTWPGYNRKRILSRPLRTGGIQLRVRISLKKSKGYKHAMCHPNEN
jgi:hypothetical protein